MRRSEVFRGWGEAFSWAVLDTAPVWGRDALGHLKPRLKEMSDARREMAFLKDRGRLVESTEGNPDCCLDALHDELVGAYYKASRSIGRRVEMSSSARIQRVREREDFSWFWDSRRTKREGWFFEQWKERRRRLNDVRRVSA